MLTPKTRSIVAAIVLSVLSTVALADGIADDCKSIPIPPNNRLPAEFQSRQPTEVIAACDSADDEQVRVVGVAFDGPSAGVLFVIDRSGLPLTAITIGRPRSIEISRLQSGGSLIIVRATIGTGTGVRQDDFLVFHVGGAHTQLTWRGLAYYRDLSPTGRGSIKTGTISAVEDHHDKSILIDHVVIERRVSASNHDEQSRGQPKTTHRETRVTIE